MEASEALNDLDLDPTSPPTALPPPCFLCRACCHLLNTQTPPTTQNSPPNVILTPSSLQSLPKGHGNENPPSL